MLPSHTLQSAAAPVITAERDELLRCACYCPHGGSVIFIIALALPKVRKSSPKEMICQAESFTARARC